MFLLHFSKQRGDGGEYIVLTEDSDRSTYEDHAKPGFELQGILEVDVTDRIKGSENSLPMESPLVYEQ